MTRYIRLFLWLLPLMLLACKKKDSASPVAAGPQLIFKFKFDSTQVRLDNFGNPSGIPSGNAGLSPVFSKIAAHYVELTPTEYVKLGDGPVLYNGPSSTAGGDKAIDFDQEVKVGEGEVFLSVPLKDIKAGSYNYVRVSLAYQSYDVKLRANSMDISGRLSSFIGYNTYIKTFKPKDSLVSVNANKLQGYWAFETKYSLSQGQAAKTTVPNPIASSSPIPAGSCVVTGKFGTPFVISGNETKDITITLSLSTNKSFEWKDDNSNGVWEPLNGEKVVDMGIRGLIPLVQ